MLYRSANAQRVRGIIEEVRRTGCVRGRHVQRVVSIQEVWQKRCLAEGETGECGEGNRQNASTAKWAAGGTRVTAAVSGWYSKWRRGIQQQQARRETNSVSPCRFDPPYRSCTGEASENGCPCGAHGSHVGGIGYAIGEGQVRYL